MSSAQYERMPGAAPGIDMYRDDYYKPHDQMGYINRFKTILITS